MTQAPNTVAAERVRATSRSLPIALIRARERVMRPIREMLADVGVTEQQWRVLRVLSENGPSDATEIAREACLLMPSLTRISQVLEKKGYLTRGNHPTDRRRALISITRKGQGLIDANTPESNRIFDDLENDYGRERLNLLLDLLDDIPDRRT